MFPSYGELIDTTFLGIRGITGEETSRYSMGGWILFRIPGIRGRFSERV